MAKNCDTIYKN